MSEGRELNRVDCPEVDVSIYPPCVTKLEGEADRRQPTTIRVVPSRRGEEEEKKREEEEEEERTSFIISSHGFENIF